MSWMYLITNPIIHCIIYLFAIHISPPQLTQARHARSLAFSRFAAFSLLHQIKSSPCIHILLTISTPPPLLFYIIFLTIWIENSNTKQTNLHVSALLLLVYLIYSSFHYFYLLVV